ETDGYFTDFNGDGLPDIVTGGTVRFNTTSTWEIPSNTNFNVNANLSPNPINSGGIDSSLIDNLELETLDELRADFSQFDHIKVWKAPYTGSIKIQGTATLITKNNCGNPTEQNQFRLTIERGVEGQTSLAQPVGPERNLNAVGDFQNYNLTGITVSKGDLFFFRIHNKVYGCGGEIDWNPEITYTNFPIGQNIDDIVNEHEKQQRIFKAEDDYAMNNGGSWMPNSDDNTISIQHNLNFTQHQFSDDINFVIEKTTNTHSTSGTNEGEIINSTSSLWTATYNPNSISGNISIPPMPSGFGYVGNQYGTSPSANRSYVFRFYIESDSNIQWDAINWQPTITANSNTYYPGVSYLTYDD